MSRARVLLADDHAIVIDGLRRILEPEFEIAGVADNGRVLLSAAKKLKPDVIVLDISMPLLNGIEAARQLKKEDPNMKIIFLTMHADATYATEALEAGASGYVLKQSAAAELLVAIENALKGRVYLTPLIAGDVLQSYAAGTSRRSKKIAKLTPRQREVLQLIAEGHTIQQIAEILHISPRTVEFHKYRIGETLGLHSTAELIRYAIKHGLTG